MAADNLILDLTNYRDNVGNYVKPARYLVQVEDAEQGESSNKKTPQLTLWLRVVGGAEDGLTLVENLYLTPNSLFRVVGFLNSIGIKTPKKKLELRIQSLIGKRLFVITEDDTYNGRTRSRVTGFEKFDDPNAAKAGAEPVDELASLVTEAAGEPLVTVPAPAVEEAALVAATEVVSSPTVVNPSPTVVPTSAPAPVAVAEDGDDDGIDLDDLNL